MSTETCDYVARKDDPESWHGTDPSDFHLDRPSGAGGFEVTEWRCPHPPLDRDDADDQYCVFHTDPEEVPDEIDEREALLDALDKAGNGPREDRPEHRGQFVGATFGAIDFSGETIAATDDHDIRFDHARFRADDGDLDFSGTTFETQGQHHLSFQRAEFTTDGDGHVRFDEATFRTDGDGYVWFERATFSTDGDGHVGFNQATFRTDGDGDIWFRWATFRSDGDGHVWFNGVDLSNVVLQAVDFGDANLSGVTLTGADLREAHVSDIAVNGATTCERLHTDSDFDAGNWDGTARAYHDLKTVFSGHGLVGKARRMHVRERRARSEEAKAANGRFDSRYLGSLPSRIFTGYGVQVRKLLYWMVGLFLVSTAVYVYVGVEDSLLNNVAYSVLAFTVAPPEMLTSFGFVPNLVMMIETFFGTLSIVLLGYILGNRERF